MADNPRINRSRREKNAVDVEGVRDNLNLSVTRRCQQLALTYEPVVWRILLKNLSLYQTKIILFNKYSPLIIVIAVILLIGLSNIWQIRFFFLLWYSEMMFIFSEMATCVLQSTPVLEWDLISLQIQEKRVIVNGGRSGQCGTVISFQILLKTNSRNFCSNRVPYHHATNYPARSCDWTPRDFFLLYYIQSSI